MTEIVIVIPAYKTEFIAETLIALQNQNGGSFPIFVGIDGRNDQLKQIVSRFETSLRITLIEFSENIGRMNPALHWQRCVDQVNAEWIWLFSDDDVPHQDCCMAARRVLKANDRDCEIFRFNTKVIDCEGKVQHISPPHPVWETSQEFLYHRLCFARSSFAVEYIFKKSALTKAGGFVHLPLAWCADDLTWARIGGSRGIACIDGACVLWRSSRTNISGAAKGKEKMEAAFGYLSVIAEMPDPQLGPLCRARAFSWYFKQGLATKSAGSIGNILRVSRIAARPSWKAVIAYFLLRINSAFT